MAEKTGDNSGKGEKQVDLIFFMGLSDNPGNVITPIQLCGSNYDEWARAIRTSLQAKRKYGFVEGKVPKPTTPEKLEDWTVVHSMLIAWLLNTIEPSLRSTLSYYDDAQSLWTHLKQHFCVVNGTRICQLKGSLGECKKGKDEEVSVYFGRLSHIWDELVTYIKKPTCTCGGCLCDINKQVTDLLAEDYLHHFLIGLDGAYTTIHSNLLSQDPLPNIDQSYQRVIQDERLLRGDSSTHQNRNNIMAFRVTPDAREKATKTTHVFSFMGSLSGGGGRPRDGRGPGCGGATAGRGSGRSGGHGRGTHNAPVRANKAAVGTSCSGAKDGQSHAPPNSIETAGISGLTSAQWQQILDALNVSKTKDRLHDYKYTSGIAGWERCNCYEGGQCDLRWWIDRTTRKLIGAGERSDGLYFFWGVPKLHALVVEGVSSMDLWHKRLGHPSVKVLKFLPTVSSFDRSTNKKTCDICPRAKQHRDSFPLSENNASSLFELVDCDLWGSYRTPSSCGAQYYLTVVDDYSRAVWVYLLCNKTEIETMFMNFVAFVDRQFDKKIKRVRSDNGTEFNCLRDYILKQGIVFETSCVVPKFDNMKIFGCLCYAHNQRRDGDKFASRSRKCIFVGYPYGKKGWKLYDLESREYFVSRDVKFYEHEFLFSAQHDPTHSPSPIEYTADDIDASHGGGLYP
ncbi:uncharacterized protein LOC133806808 [Humulus lupulus]|uniref:uncharacterized protein LOC133806808 n=1 Tax=Humulus lupulus TaxID=3486 RepID=UPI002B4055A7|nr:uncharacterized protein LOC133806808 [Humulus lupulus]